MDAEAKMEENVLRRLSECHKARLIKTTQAFRIGAIASVNA